MGQNASSLSLLGSYGTGRAFDLDHYLVQTPRQRDAIFRFRYEAYTRNALIRPSATGMLSDWQDDEPDSSIYGITLQGRLVGTIRMAPITAQRRACVTYEQFEELIDPILENGEMIADGSRLAVTCADPRTRRRVFMYAMQIAAAYAQHHNADRGAILARHDHAAFYRRHGFEMTCGPFESAEALTPLCLMMVTFPKAVAELPQSLVAAGSRNMAMRAQNERGTAARM